MKKTMFITLGILTILSIIGFYMYFHIQAEVKASLKRKTAHLENPFGVDIWCKNKPNVEKYLLELFPKTQFFEWDFMSEAPKGFDENNPNHSVYFVKNHSDENALYPFEISFEHLDRKIWTDNRIYTLAKYITKKENNRCLVPYTHPKTPNFPYYSLLFTEEGKSYLVDDSAYDNETVDVNILKEINLMDD